MKTNRIYSLLGGIVAAGAMLTGLTGCYTTVHSDGDYGRHYRSSGYYGKGHYYGNGYRAYSSYRPVGYSHYRTYGNTYGPYRAYGRY